MKAFLFMLAAVTAAPSLSFAVENGERCELQLVDEIVTKAFNPPDLKLFLAKAAENEKLQIELPFTFSSSYEAGLLELPPYEFQTSLDCQALYLAHSGPTKIFKWLGSRNAESWHASRIDFEGFHFVMAFASEAARDRAMEHIYPDFRDYNMAESVKPFRGKAKIEGVERWLVIVPSPESFGLIRERHAQLGLDKLTKNRFVPALKEELEVEATWEESTSKGTRYYFRYGKILGFIRKGKSYRYVEPTRAYVNEAAHFEILRKQMRLTGFKVPGRGVAVPMDPLAVLEAGRLAIETWIAEMESQSGSDSPETVRLRKTLADRLEHMSVLLSSASKKYPQTLAGSLAFFAKQRLDLFAKLFDALPEETRAKLAFIREMSYDVARLKKGQPNTQKILRFVRVANESVSSWGFYFTEVGNDSGKASLLHDQMLRFAFSPRLIDMHLSSPDGPNKLKNHLQGGVLSVKYDAEGNPESVFIPKESAMGVIRHNELQGEPLKMTDAENKALEKDLLRTLKL